MSDSVRPHRRQPTRLPRPWDSPGKNTGVGCYFLLQCMKVKSEREVAQSCPTLSDPMDCSLPGSCIHEIFQARVLEWGAIAFSDHIFIELYISDLNVASAASCRTKVWKVYTITTIQLRYFCYKSQLFWPYCKQFLFMRITYSKIMILIAKWAMKYILSG